MSTNKLFWVLQTQICEAQINEAYDLSVPKINSKPVLIKRKQADKKLDAIFGDTVA